MTRPLWEPGELWKGEDAYIIGGGPSLQTFDWELIRGKKTVGCNSAFILGADLVKIVVFGDYLWWKNIGEKRLPEYGGLVVACSPRLEDDWDTPPWLLWKERLDGGLSRTALGYNHNTGSLAINLALQLGAKRVFLLGFDMRMEDEKPNWHDVRYEAGNPDSYSIFKERLRAVKFFLPKVFPGTEVVNVSDVSELEVFPKVSIAEHFGVKGKAKS